MTRRTRRRAPYVAAHPDDVLHIRQLEGENVQGVTEPVEPAKSEPPAGKAALTTGTREREDEARATTSQLEKPAAPQRDKTLHELNLEARAIDREHARIREEAAAKARDVLEPMLKGVPRVRGLVRRLQKNLRPPVTE